MNCAFAQEIPPEMIVVKLSHNVFFTNRTYLSGNAPKAYKNLLCLLFRLFPCIAASCPSIRKNKKTKAVL